MFQNQLLKPRINWKNLCIVFSIIFFIVGFCSAKIFANGYNKAEVINGIGPEIVFNVDNNSQINPNYNEEQAKNQLNQGIQSIGLQPATPLILSTQKASNIVITAVAQITEGGNAVLPNAAYSTLPLQYYNLLINYYSPVKGFAKFIIQYDINGVAQIKEVCYPIQEGNNTLTIPNWLLKGTYNTQGIPINFNINNLQVIKSQVVFN